MKALKNHRAEQLLIRYDNELRELLLNDLLRYTFKKPSIGNNQVMTASTLSVA